MSEKKWRSSEYDLPDIRFIKSKKGGSKIKFKAFLRARFHRIYFSTLALRRSDPLAETGADVAGGTDKRMV
jgi:hypothetical protein